MLEKTTQPYVGITTDGRLRGGLFGIADEGLDTGPILAAARDLLDALGPAGRGAVMHPADAGEWRRWTNAYPTWVPHGLMLEDAPQPQRDAVRRLVTACMSARGARETRDCMLTPSFYGAEPRISDRAPYPGIRLFDAEIDRGRELILSLDAAQRSRAVLNPSMLSADLPPELNHPAEGRMRAVRGGDNMVLPYEGLCAADMSDSQRALLTSVIDAYVGRLPGPAAAARAAQIERHYGETYFAWVGKVEDEGPCYYKVHSPVVLIELDCHAGIFLANDEPEPFHVHTVVRTPNGNDYGKDLLRQHYVQAHAGARHAHADEREDHAVRPQV